ncbi:FHA domain-containing protein [Bradyrhizobium sp.]|uniref:FHA domain-containing protein n=1 Tax=Bradyrhizobium sp. TaxID=376 RepID=UPI003C3A1553
MIWVEILSRHRDIAARFRITAPEVRIGRGYDNDVIVDDPYVAAQHLRVFRDEAGQLVAEDLGSANGTFLDGSRSRLARVVVDGKQPIRIGQTYLRVREPSHEVEPERTARPQWRILPVVVAAALGAAVLGMDALRIWLSQVTEARASSYLTPLLSGLAVIVVWVGIWTLLSRIFSGRSHLIRNLLIALAGLFAFSLYNELAQYLAFGWTWSAASTYQYVAAWSALAVVCFLHLRGVGPGRVWLKAALVTALLVVAVTVEQLQRSEAFSDSGRQTTAHVLMPPALRAVPFRDEAAFFGEIADLKPKLDRDLAEARTAEATTSEARTGEARTGEARTGEVGR